MDDPNVIPDWALSVVEIWQLNDAFDNGRQATRNAISAMNTRKAYSPEQWDDESQQRLDHANVILKAFDSGY